MTNGSCPRCRGFMAPDLDGPACVNCGYVDYQAVGHRPCVATMSQPPGLTAETSMERYEEGQDRRGDPLSTYWQRRKKRERIEDEALGEAVARRLGVTLEELQSNAQDTRSRELRSLGLSHYRIGNLLARSDNAIRAVLEREGRARG